MLLIFLSRAAFSLLTASFGSLRFFSFGTSPARGWRWPTGAWTDDLSEFFGTDEDPCANASGTTNRTNSATDRIICRFLVLPLGFCRRLLFIAPERRPVRNCVAPVRRNPEP